MITKPPDVDDTTFIGIPSANKNNQKGKDKEETINQAKKVISILSASTNHHLTQQKRWKHKNDAKYLSYY